MTPRKEGLLRSTIQRNAAKQRSSLLAQTLPARSSSANDPDHRPSYTTETLRQLKDSTPSTPREPSPAEPLRELDLSSKFGSSLARYDLSAAASAIPSAAEIAEKKSRRARLAKEQQADEYISLDPDDPNLDGASEDEDDENVTTDERGRLILASRDKYQQAESRLVRDDEDLMEGFDAFTEDGKVALGAKAEAAALRQRKVEMAAQIAEAEAHTGDPFENDDGEDSDASERERNAAFEAAQTRHGTYHAGADGNGSSNDPYADLRPRTPAKITPLPTLDGTVDRLRRQLAELQTERSGKVREMAGLQKEKIRLGEEEVRIQQALRDTAEKFRLLRKERGVEEPNGEGTRTRPRLLEVASDNDAHAVGQDRTGDEVGEEDHEAQRNGLGTGLGFGMAGAGAGLGSMSMPRTHEINEDDY